MQTHCPACKAKFTGRERWRFGPGLRREPRPAPCPHCGELLAPNRAACELLFRGSVCQLYFHLALLLSLFRLIPYDYGWPFLVPAIPALIYGHILSIRGQYHYRLEIISANHHQTAPKPDIVGDTN